MPISDSCVGEHIPIFMQSQGTKTAALLYIWSLVNAASANASNVLWHISHRSMSGRQMVRLVLQWTANTQQRPSNAHKFILITYIEMYMSRML